MDFAGDHVNYSLTLVSLGPSARFESLGELGESSRNSPQLYYCHGRCTISTEEREGS